MDKKGETTEWTKKEETTGRKGWTKKERRNLTVSIYSKKFTGGDVR